MRMTGAAVLTAAAALGIGVLGSYAPAAAAEPSGCWDDVLTDFDGGGPDVVIGLPHYDRPGKPDAGAIAIYSDVAAPGSAQPRAPRHATILTADDFDGLTSQAGAEFGASVAVWLDAGSLDDPDECADLLVGAPGQTLLGQKGAGQVYVLSGADSGLGQVAQVYDENALTGTGGSQAGARFGASIAVDTGSTIAVGAPGRDVGDIPNAGRVVRLDVTAGRDAPVAQVIEQQGEEDEGSEPGDRFGQVLDLMGTWAGDVLAVGIPREDIGTTVDAGAVMLFPLVGEPSMMTQNRRHAGGHAEAGDRYGASLAHWWTFRDSPTAMLAIGVPGESVRGRDHAGMVSFATFALTDDNDHPATPLDGVPVRLTQDSPGIPGSVERGDRYGSSVVAGEIGADDGRTHLAVGSPREDLGRAADAGMVSMTRFETDAPPSSGGQPATWTQNSPSVAGVAESGDRFGARMSIVQLTTPSDDDDVVWAISVVTAPGEDVHRVSDVGVAYLGFAPGSGSVRLVPPRLQRGAGLGMVPMQVFYGA